MTLSINRSNRDFFEQKKIGPMALAQVKIYRLHAVGYFVEWYNGLQVEMGNQWLRADGFEILSNSSLFFLLTSFSCFLLMGTSFMLSCFILHNGHWIQAQLQMGFFS